MDQLGQKAETVEDPVKQEVPLGVSVKVDLQRGGSGYHSSDRKDLRLSVQDPQETRKKVETDLPLLPCSIYPVRDLGRVPASVAEEGLSAPAQAVEFVKELLGEESMAQ